MRYDTLAESAPRGPASAAAATAEVVAAAAGTAGLPATETLQDAPRRNLNLAKISAPIAKNRMLLRKK